MLSEVLGFRFGFAVFLTSSFPFPKGGWIFLGPPPTLGMSGSTSSKHAGSVACRGSFCSGPTHASIWKQPQLHWESGPQFVCPLENHGRQLNWPLESFLWLTCGMEQSYCLGPVQPPVPAAPMGGASSRGDAGEVRASCSWFVLPSQALVSRHDFIDVRGWKGDHRVHRGPFLPCLQGSGKLASSGFKVCVASLLP